MKFDNFQTFGKEGFEAFIASATAFNKGMQAMAQENAEFARKSMTLTSATYEKALAARSFERVVEVQQGYAKEAYEAALAQANKLGELYVESAKEAYKPFEASMAAFGFKSTAA
jgi:phasin family protein